MSTNRQFESFQASLEATLHRQTGLDLGQFCAFVLSGQNPSHPSGVAEFAQELSERRALGEKIKRKDFEALLELVLDYMRYQALSGRDRVTFARQVLARMTPTLAAADLESLSASDVSSLEVTDEMRAEARSLLKALGE